MTASIAADVLGAGAVAGHRFGATAAADARHPAAAIGGAEPAVLASSHPRSESLADSRCK
jgi:hypothetical protein